MHRILYISANGFPESAADGRGAFSLEHAAALQHEGARVLAVDTGYGRFGQDEVGGVTIKRMPRLRGLAKGFKFGALGCYLRRLYELRQGSHDAIIFSFFYLKYLPLLFLLRRRGVIVLFIAHGGEVMPGGMVRRLMKRLMFDRADLVTPVSEFTATLLSCLIGRKDRDDHKITTIYNGVDWRKLRPTHSDAEMRARLNLPEDAFIVLSICNLIPRKGIDLLVEANLRLIDEGVNLHHIVIGRGPQREMLGTMILQSGHRHRFQFIDRVEAADLANFYAMADLFAMISKTGWSANQTEGFGVTFVEAMALGTPVVGGGGSGATTPVKHGFNGLLVDPHAHDAVNQVADAVRTFISDPEFRKATGENARRNAKTFFDWSQNARQTLAMIDHAGRQQRTVG